MIVRNLLAGLGLATALVGGGLLYQAQAGNGGAPERMAVTYGDLDLSQRDGRLALEDRIAAAAERVCAPYAAAPRMREQCVGRAMASAAPQVRAAIDQVGGEQGGPPPGWMGQRWRGMEEHMGWAPRRTVFLPYHEIVQPLPRWYLEHRPDPSYFTHPSRWADYRHGHRHWREAMARRLPWISCRRGDIQTEWRAHYCATHRG